MKSSYVLREGVAIPAGSGKYLNGGKGMQQMGMRFGERRWEGVIILESSTRWLMRRTMGCRGQMLEVNLGNEMAGMKAKL